MDEHGTDFQFVIAGFDFGLPSYLVAIQFSSKDSGKTEDYEVDCDADVTSDRLWERRPEAQILVERIGYPAVFHALGAVDWP